MNDYTLVGSFDLFDDIDVEERTVGSYSPAPKSSNKLPKVYGTTKGNVRIEIGENEGEMIPHFHMFFTSSGGKGNAYNKEITCKLLTAEFSHMVQRIKISIYPMMRLRY